jgi:hypothetical protein
MSDLTLSVTPVDRRTNCPLATTCHPFLKAVAVTRSSERASHWYNHDSSAFGRTESAKSGSISSSAATSSSWLRLRRNTFAAFGRCEHGTAMPRAEGVVAVATLEFDGERSFSGRVEQWATRSKLGRPARGPPVPIEVPAAIDSPLPGTGGIRP